MTPSKEFRELRQLLGELVDGQLTDVGSARLVELLGNDPAARSYYLDYMEIHAQLAWKHQLCDIDDMGDDQTSKVDESATCVPSSSSVIAPCSSQENSISAGQYMVGGFPLSYVIGVMIVGLGLAVASACEVSHLQAIAKDNTQAAPAVNVPEPVGEGKTGSDCVKGRTGCVSSMELRACSREAMDQPKIAKSEREVARTR
jgi:hypothetical protein